MEWAFQQLSSALDSKEVDLWRKAVESWERGENPANPYEIRSKGADSFCPNPCFGN